MKRLISLLPLLLLVGCESVKNYDSWDYRELHGKVSQVRILQAGDTIVKDDNHPVAGAIVGHALIGGAKGAIIGAALGSGDVTKTHVEEVKACELYVRFDGVDHKFLIQNGELLSRCALSQPGDDAAIQFHWEHDQQSPNTAKTSLYTWQCESNEFNWCAKEEMP